MPTDLETWDAKKCLQLIKDDPKNYVAYYRMAAICFEKADVEGAK